MKTSCNCGPFSSRYMFTIEASVDSQLIGQSPEGQRLDMQYATGQSSELYTKETDFCESWLDPISAADWVALSTSLALDVGKPEDPRQDKVPSVFEFRRGTCLNDKQKQAAAGLRKGTLSSPLAWFGFEGDIASGSDWVLVRNDGVAEFSGRFTFRSGDSDGALIDAVFTAVVDLSSSAGSDAPNGQPVRAAALAAFDALSKGDGAGPLPLLMAATFDTAGTAASWAPKRMIQQAEGFWKYARLTRGQFIAIGDTDLLPKMAFNPPTAISLDIYEVRPDLPSSWPTTLRSHSSTGKVPRASRKGA